MYIHLKLKTQIKVKEQHFYFCSTFQNWILTVQYGGSFKVPVEP
jgi:hypothetical protein